MSHDATLMIVNDEAGRRAVVTHADDVIWVDPELWAQVNDPDHKVLPGGGEADGDLFAFGTEGEGLGRLTYRRTGDANWYGHRFIVFERVNRG